MAHIEMVNGKPVLRDDWNIEDIMSVADCMDVQITEDDAALVLEIVADNFDANVGINWQVIEYAIERIVDIEGEQA